MRDLETALEFSQHELFLKNTVKRHSTVRGCFMATFTVLVLCFISAAAGFSVHVGLKVLGAVSQVQGALGNLQTILTVFYSFACQNVNFDIFTPEECQQLCTVMDCPS